MKKAAPKLPKIDILYEDADFVAINKPAGLVVHSDGKTVEPLLTDWVVENYPKTAKVGEPIVIGAPKDIAENASAVLAAPTGPASTISSAPAEDEDDATTPERIALTIIERPGIVHRLDRGTSGVIVIAKNQKAHAALKEQFQARSVSKKYLAFVYGEFADPADKYGTINRPIGRSKKDFRRFSAQRGARGEMRPAETWYTVLASRKGLDDGTGRRAGGGYAFLEVEPKTGRTHQIRVHFKAINHPIVCDDLYAAERECALGFGRPALHASSIEFTTMKGKRVTATAPMPADFKKACRELEIDVKALPITG
jgi:RluA family pseudouridine synthase